MRLFAGLLVLLAAPAFAADAGLREQVTDLFRRRQWTEAQAILEKLIAAEPANADGHFYLGQALMARGELAPAVRSFEQATSLIPTNSEYFRLLGDAYGVSAQKAGIFAKFGLAKKCKAAYDKAVELDPASINARWSVMEYCRMAPAIAGGGMDGAYAQAAEIRKLDAARGRMAYAGLYTHEKKYPEAFALFEEVLRDSPDDYGALFQIGRLAAVSGERFDRGLTALRHCLTLTPPAGQPDHSRVHWRIGDILEKQGDRPGARASYGAALKLDPQFPQAIESLKKFN